MSGDGTHVIKLGNYWRITNLPLRSWIAPLYMYQQSIEQATALYKLDQQRFVRREILSYALLNSDWTSGFFLLILRAYRGLPQPAACFTLCMHYMHAHTHTHTAKQCDRPPSDQGMTKQYTKSVSCTYTLLLRGQLFFLYHGESVYISHVNCLLFWCAVYKAVIRCNFLCAPPGLPCEVLHSL